MSRGGAITITARVTSKYAGNALIDVEVYNPSGQRVYQRSWDAQSFTAGQTRSYRPTWTVPTSAATGTYIVKIGVFSPGWGTLHHWNDRAVTFTVR